MVTKDVATTQIEESLLKANSLGHEELCEGKSYRAKRRWVS